MKFLIYNDNNCHDDIEKKFDNEVSAIAIPEGYRVTLFDYSNCSGSSFVAEGNLVDLYSLQFDDIASSYQCHKSMIKNAKLA